MNLNAKPDRRETMTGCIYLAVYLFLLPGVLTGVNPLLPRPLSPGMLNFVYYCVNFLAVCLIFRKYLLQTGKDFLKQPIACLWYAVLGYFGNLALSQLLNTLIFRISPDFFNINDASVLHALQDDLIPMTVGVVVLVPVAEEALFRGLIFRGLHDRSPALAYIVSMAAFAAIHVTGYIGQAEPATLLLCFLQYLPAGYCLAFAYRHSGTLLSPILIHAAINAAALFTMR